MPKKSIEIIKLMSLRGPSIWAYRPIIEAWVDIGELEDFPSNTLPGFNQRLSAWLPGLIEHRCSIGERGGFLQRLRDGTWPAHILEHVTLELQTLAGFPGGLGRARETSRRGVYKVIVRAWYEPLTRAALYAARDLVMAAIEDRPFDVEDTVEQLRELAEDLKLGPSTESIVSAADDRDIPMIRLSDTHNLVQLGYGAAQRRIWTAESNQTSAIAEGIASDKALTKSLLEMCGVPVPEGQEVDSVDQAWEAAQDIGLPVVVKPVDGNHGRGVFTNLTTREDIETAYTVAVDEGSGVVVERFVPGNEHRLLVVGNRMVAAARGDAACVTGDGKHTVQELIDLQINSDPRRGSLEDHPLNFIRIDSAARLELKRQGLTGDSIVPAEKSVVIQRNGNVSIDVTSQVHPAVAQAAVLAAQVVGLDIAGIDLVATDIGLPLHEQGGAIVEVNAGPGLLMHLKPSEGDPQPVGQAIIEHLFPEGDNGQIPIVGVTGSQGKTIVARLVNHILRLAGLHTGLACSDGLFFDNRQVHSNNAANWEQARRVLLNRAVQAGVIENGGPAILTEGLAYERCKVGIVTSINEQATFPDLYIEDGDQLVKVYRTQIDVVLPNGTAILNADDERVAALAELSDGEVIFFGTDNQSHVLTQHRNANGRAVVARDGWVFLQQGTEQSVLLELDQIPCLNGDQTGSLARWALAAIATGWALGLDLEVLRTGVQTFGQMPSEPVPDHND
jgi:cyanophycin synthetase